MTLVNFRHLHELLNTGNIAAMHAWLDVLEKHQEGKHEVGIRYRFQHKNHPVAEVWIDLFGHVNFRMLTDNAFDVIVWTPDGVRPRSIKEVNP